MALISIIVPAYNVEKYLSKCIDSILKQSYTDFELLLIDDGSTDKTSLLCDEYARLDNRIKCFHKENGGLSDARNYGIEHMSGEYVTFVDGDDYISEKYIECLFNLFSLDCEVQIAMLPGQVLRESDSPSLDTNEDIKIYTNIEAMKKMMLRQGITHASWGKLFSAHLWSKIRFPVGQNYEDYATTYYVFQQAKKIAFCSSRLYYYIQHGTSIMHQECSKKTLTVLDVADEVTEYIIQNCPDCQLEARALQTAVYLKNMQAILNTGYNSYPEYQKRVYQIVHKNEKHLLISKIISRNDKIKIILLNISKKMFLKVYNSKQGDISI